jgi:TonB-dependent SusC/RagA subfamily outer membrane receptor
VALAVVASACRTGTPQPSDQSGTRTRGAGAPSHSQAADKDAGSIAEYGVRGANGVVLIKTKRGR